MGLPVWQPVGVMSDACFERILDDLRAVPLVDEPLVEAYADGRWLYEPSCSACGIPLDRRRRSCLTCMGRHEKRRQRLERRPGAVPAPTFKELARDERKAAP